MSFLARNRVLIVPVFLLLLAPAFLNGPAGAQEAAPHRPKIALVLSGGGARGFAHVGAIEWLEEHRIPVAWAASLRECTPPA